MSSHLVPQGASGPAGVEEHGQRSSGFPGNLRDPDVSIEDSGSGDRMTKLPGPRRDAHGRGERNTGEAMVSGSRR